MNAHGSEKSIALRLRVLHTHARDTEDRTPSRQARQLACYEKSEEVKHFCTERPQRAKQENWQGVAKSSRNTACFWLLAN